MQLLDSEADQAHAAITHAVTLQRTEERYNAELASVASARDEVTAELERARLLVEAQTADLDEQRSTAVARRRLHDDAIAELQRRVELLTSERDDAMSFQHQQDAERLASRQHVALLQRRAADAETECRRWESDAEAAERALHELRAQREREKMQSELWERKEQDTLDRKRFIQDAIAVRAIPRGDSSWAGVHLYGGSSSQRRKHKGNDHQDQRAVVQGDEEKQQQETAT